MLRYSPAELFQRSKGTVVFANATDDVVAIDLLNSRTTYVGMIIPPFVFATMTSTPCFASPLDIVLIMLNEDDEVVVT